MPWILHIRRPRQRPYSALHPYQVILHKDTCNHYPDGVVDMLRAVIPSLPVAEALAVVLDAWKWDQRVIITCPKEAAEYYQTCLRDSGLAITIEPQ
jgi:ATP-dependent Clp protease adapter protein ClpS